MRQRRRKIDIEKYRERGELPPSPCRQCRRALVCANDCEQWLDWVRVVWPEVCRPFRRNAP